MPVRRDRTALRRPDLSRPIRLTLEDGLISEDTSVFDYGCGYSDDVRRLRQKGILCSGWDPAHNLQDPLTEADVVNLGYVINVIEDPAERKEVLHQSWELAQQLLIVSAQLVHEDPGELVPHNDGVLTARNTFQKYFEQHELRQWIDNSLGVQSVARAPGVFYVFQDQAKKQSFLASRVRRSSGTSRVRLSDQLFEQHRELLGSLMKFLSSRGRLPRKEELENVSEIERELGSVRRAFTIIKRVTGLEDWERIRQERSDDLLVYLALARFGGRPRFSELPADLQADIRAFFSTYKHASMLADQLLFSAGDTRLINAACRKSPVGKFTATALYVHRSALSNLPAILRVYEGCAKEYIGTVEGANIIKLYRRQPKISYLLYLEFEKDPHPTLSESLLVDFLDLRVRHRNYRGSENPSILHRKEAFVDDSHPLRARFERLTLQEERFGLYKQAARIGRRRDWETHLIQNKVAIRGHVVRRC